jgi:hypothetical protein
MCILRRPHIKCPGAAVILCETIDNFLSYDRTRVFRQWRLTSASYFSESPMTKRSSQALEPFVLAMHGATSERKC